MIHQYANSLSELQPKAATQPTGDFTPTMTPTPENYDSFCTLHKPTSTHHLDNTKRLSPSFDYDKTYRIQGIKINQQTFEVVKEQNSDTWKLKKAGNYFSTFVTRLFFVNPIQHLNLYPHYLKLSNGEALGSLEAIRSLLMKTSSENQIELKGSSRLMSQPELITPWLSNRSNSSDHLPDMSRLSESDDDSLSSCSDTSSIDCNIHADGSNRSNDSLKQSHKGYDQKSVDFYHTFKTKTTERIEELDQKIANAKNDKTKQKYLRRRNRLQTRLHRDLNLIKQCITQGFVLKEWEGWANTEKDVSIRNGTSQFESSTWERTLTDENEVVKTERFIFQHTSTVKMGDVNFESQTFEPINIKTLSTIDDFSQAAPIRRVNENGSLDEKGWDFRGQTTHDLHQLSRQAMEIVNTIKSNPDIMEKDDGTIAALLALITNQIGSLKLPPDGYDEASSAFQATGLPDKLVFALSSLIFLTASDLLIEMGALEDGDDKAADIRAFLAMSLGCQAGFIKYSSLFTAQQDQLMESAAADVLTVIGENASYGLHGGLGLGALLTLWNGLSDQLDSDALPHQRNKWKTILGSTLLVGGNSMAMAGYASSSAAEALGGISASLPLPFEPTLMCVGAVFVIVQLLEEMQLENYGEESLNDKSKKMATNDLFRKLSMQNLQKMISQSEFQTSLKTMLEEGNLEGVKSLLNQSVAGRFEGDRSYETKLYKSEFKTVSNTTFWRSAGKGEWGKAYRKFSTNRYTYNAHVLRSLFKNTKVDVRFDDNIRAFSKQNSKMLKELAVKTFSTREQFVDAVLALRFDGQSAFTLESSSRPEQTLEFISAKSRFAKKLPYEAMLLSTIANELDELANNKEQQMNTINATKGSGDLQQRKIETLKQTINTQQLGSNWRGFIYKSAHAFHPISSIALGHGRVVQLAKNGMRSFGNARKADTTTEKLGYYSKGIMELTVMPLHLINAYIYRPLMHTAVLAPLNIAYNTTRSALSAIRHSAPADGFNLHEMVDQIQDLGFDKYLLKITEALIHKSASAAVNQAVESIPNADSLKTHQKNREKLKLYFNKHHDFMFGVVFNNPVVQKLIDTDSKIISRGMEGKIALADFTPLQSAT